MRRHTPTLFPHTEQDIQQVEDADEADWEMPRPIPYTAQSMPASPSLVSHRSRIKPRMTHSVSKLNPTNPPSSAIRSTSKYSDVYLQFVRRYRSQPGIGSDIYDDPDSYYFHRNFGEPVDVGDSDEDDLTRISASSSGIIPRSAAPSEPLRSPTLEERERLEWQTMLASVLDGDVLKSEKTRIADTLESLADEQTNILLDIWLGIRAKFHGVTMDEERKSLEDQRLRIVDAVIEEVLSFRVDPANHDTTFALKQVNVLMRRLDIAQSLYPSLRAFHLDKPASTHPGFQARRDALNAWSTVLITLRDKINLLRRWTGSDTLDVTQPNTNAEVAVGTDAVGTSDDHRTEIADGSSFVERVLKEESMQRTFEKGFLSTVHSFLSTARDTQVNHSLLLKEMNLPTFENELVALISFPTKLAQAGLCILLDYVRKPKDPDVLIIDQLTDDLKLNIGLACTLKRQYEVFLTPDPGGNWNLPQCISEDYDATILEALSRFFKLINWKFKSDVKGVYFTETDLLEAHWPTFSDVSLTTPGGSSLVATQLCALTNKLMFRVTNYFETQVRVPIPLSSDSSDGRTSLSTNTQNYPHSASPANRKMTNEQMVKWYGKVLDSVRWRYRKLQRFARLLTQRFSNSAEFSLEDVALDRFISRLVATNHLLVYTQTFEEDGTYVIASNALGQQPETIRRMLTEAFHVDELADDGIHMDGYNDPSDDEYERGGYVLLLSPRSQFLWNGMLLMLDIPKIDLEIKDDRIRLIADGPRRRLALAKQQFAEIFFPADEDEGVMETEIGTISCITEQQAHLPAVNRELKKIARATHRLAESVVDSVRHVRNSLRTINSCQQLLENWYLFASENGQYAQKYLEATSLTKFNRLLIKLAISWVSFICDDCDPTDRRTFKSAVNALEFALHWTRRNDILELPEDQFEMLRQKVASCMTLLISHFDILGARQTLEARREKERQEDLLRKQPLNAYPDDSSTDPHSISSDSDDSSTYLSPLAYTDASVRSYWEKAAKSIQRIECDRTAANAPRPLGRVLDAEKPEDRSLAFLASLNTQIQWQQGRFIGAGAFGSVYLALNLDTGSPMAVKEIKFQDLSNLPTLISQIKDELAIMQLLHHPNVVEYYGIEVHRDRVYIFEEYCQGGSLAALLEHGRIEDERIIQAYTLQMLEGIAYLHANAIVHRDIKPDNILLDQLGVIKFVDFGAAKILAKNQRTIQPRSRRAPDAPSSQNSVGTASGANLRSSLTGTPMYMSPEVIKGGSKGRYGAMDIWSMGCVVLEFATGKKPWSNLDNEWAIMFHIGVATHHPPLPEPGQLSGPGIEFIKQCLTIDPTKRPIAVELMDHPWMLDFRDALLRYEEAEIATNPLNEMPMDESYTNASVARRAALLKRKQMEIITLPSPGTPFIETSLPGNDV